MQGSYGNCAADYRADFLAILGAIATALTVTGILSMLPSFVMFVFPSVALLGLIIVGIGMGLLIKRYRLKQAEINALFEQAASLIKNIEDKIAQESQPKNFVQILDNLNRFKFRTENFFNLYNRGFHCYTITKDDMRNMIRTLQSEKKFCEEKSLWLVKMLDEQNAEQIADQKAQIIRRQQETAQSSEKVTFKWLPKVFK